MEIWSSVVFVPKIGHYLLHLLNIDVQQIQSCLYQGVKKRGKDKIYNKNFMHVNYGLLVKKDYNS